MSSGGSFAWFPEMADSAPSSEAGRQPSTKRPACTSDHQEDTAMGSDPKRRAPSQVSTDEIQIKVVFGKASQLVTRPLDSSVLELKKEIEHATGVPADARMKLLFKGQLKDDQMLRQTGLKDGSKLMVVGSKPLEASKVSAEAAQAGGGADWDTTLKKEPWAEQTQHKKVLAKGRPDDGWPAIRGKQVPLRDDQTFIPGLLNAQGTKVRLTFKPEIQQIWVAAPTHTQKINIASITKIEAEPIAEQEEYSILRMQLGSAASSSLWLYFVPSQTMASIKIRLLGVASLLE